DIACSGARDSRSPAASMVTSIAANTRSRTATNSSCLVGKTRKRFGWEMPTSLAMLTVVPPCRPFWLNSISAASRICSRRSALGTRLRGVPGSSDMLLVHTHYLDGVKHCPRGRGGHRAGCTSHLSGPEASQEFDPASGFDGVVVRVRL